ncbi:hypothetical protein RBB75_18230 [Tunturibacter empetritectus]|uniref:Uncharacterized protein n=1 Tax=Tunturiibacter empetritectus TaxID=3069691 RepID=A0AAU7ZCC8_9BACT
MKKNNGLYKWKVAVIAGAAILLLMELLLTLFTIDFVEWLCTLVITSIFICSLLLACYKKRLTAGAAIAIMIVCCVTTWVVLKKRNEIRTNTRWFFGSKRYKAQVLATGATNDGQLKHMEWDGWGFPGAGDTVVYLVFDPSDSLSTGARGNSHGKFAGIPCEVPLVNRLEDHWYTVLFYTDTDWHHCA